MLEKFPKTEPNEIIITKSLRNHNPKKHHTTKCLIRKTGKINLNVDCVRKKRRIDERYMKLNQFVTNNTSNRLKSATSHNEKRGKK